VTKSVIVVVDGDPGVVRSIQAHTGGETFEVVACATAQSGLNACVALDPACLVTALDLTGHDGLWLIGAVRGQQREMCSTPILALCSDDESRRIRALLGGADVAAQKPFGAAELVAQIQALVTMASRLRTRRTPTSPPRPSRPPAGDLERTPIASVLGALELGEESGDLDLYGPDGRLLLNLASGTVVSGRFLGTTITAVEAMRLVLAWDTGRFEFRPGPERYAPEGSPMVGSLLLAALRPEDYDEDETPSSIRHGAPLSAPGRRLVEITRPSPRPDPRVETDDRRPPPRNHRRR
jgi:two-component system, OmpR family, response regulator